MPRTEKTVLVEIGAIKEGVGLRFDNGCLATPTEWWAKRHATDLDRMQIDCMPLIDALKEAA